HNELAPVPLAIVAKGEHPPVTLSALRGLRNEHRLAGHVAVAEVVRDLVAGVKIVASQHGGAGKVARANFAVFHGVCIPVRASVAPIVDAWELCRMLVEGRLRHEPARKIDLP